MEDLFAIHGDTNGAPAEERVLFFRQVHVRQIFVPADIHGAHNHRLRTDSFSHRFVGLELLFFSGQRVAIHKQEFGAVEADAFCAVALCTGDVAHGADVGAHFNLVTVQRDRRQIFQLSQLMFFAQILGLNRFQLFQLAL